MVYRQLNELKKMSGSPAEQIDALLQKEKLWQEWKENNCANYEKPSAKDIAENLKLWEEYQKKQAKIGYLPAEKQFTGPGEKRKGKNANKDSGDFASKFTEKTISIVQENIANLRKLGQFDLNTELFKFLDLTKIEVLIEKLIIFFGLF